ncbi:mevalonate kinase [Patescibacteria group bacterium]|nr:mevalonate kinase [Patescibacteria group bacterium]
MTANEKKTIKVSAPGKIILSGEHAVVYGYPALLAAVNRRLTLKLSQTKNDIKVISGYPSYLAKYGLKKTGQKLKSNQGWKAEIDSNIPITGGMGSSAALSVAITAALYWSIKNDWNIRKINQLAYEIEKKQHGTPSGGDNTISTYGGFLWYRKETEDLKIFSNLTPKKTIKILIIDSGKPLESTGEMVEKVKKMRLLDRKKIEGIFKEIEELTRSFLRFLTGEKNYDLANLLNENQELLERIGIVSPESNRLIKKIKTLGGAAKISGAGGWKKGSGVILAYHQEPDKLMNFIKRNKLKYFQVKLGEKGVRIEKS